MKKVFLILGLLLTYTSAFASTVGQLREYSDLIPPTWNPIEANIALVRLVKTGRRPLTESQRHNSSRFTLAQDITILSRLPLVGSRSQLTKYIEGGCSVGSLDNAPSARVSRGAQYWVQSASYSTYGATIFLSTADGQTLMLSCQGVDARTSLAQLDRMANGLFQIEL